MFLKRLSNITDEKYISLYEYLLGLLAGVLVFIKPGSIGIGIFVVFNLVFHKRLKWNRSSLPLIAIIAIPFLLNLLFLWNNDSLYEGVKHGEKYVSMLLFPALILGQSFAISIKRVLNVYTFVFTVILFLAFATHVCFNQDSFKTYLGGVMVWQMGYKFATSLESHAPALNMHVAFLVMANFYLLLTSIFKIKKLKTITYRILLFSISIFILFIINTRLAIFNAFLGIVIITIKEVSNKTPKRKVLISISGVLLLLVLMSFSFVKMFPYVIEKYSIVTFKHMDKIGKLDEFNNPEAEVFNGFVTRLSIWKTAWEIAQDHLFLGVGAADGKKALTKTYIDTGQRFLAKYKFPTHNQYLDFFIKFGILGLIGVLVYMFYILWIANKTKFSLALCFFLLFFSSNLTDDFLIRYDGITFSALWVSLFTSAFYHNGFRKDHEET